MLKSSEPGLNPSQQGDKCVALEEAFLVEMAALGAEGVSARAVAARAGASASSINYHFGSMERLYGCAQQRAIRQADLWLQAWLAELSRGAPWPASAAPAFIATLIDNWCSEHRALAQAEASDIITRARSGSPTAKAWVRLWSDFWRSLAPIFSLDPDLAPVAALILQSERFAHLARWRAPHDRAGLEEVCARLVGRLARDKALLARPAPWRLGAERLTQAETLFPPLPEAAARIARAVVAAVDEEGEGALTHRATAAKAGLSLGAVTHHFPTRSALMTAGYTYLYQTLIQAAERTVVRTAEHSDLGRHMLSFLDLAGSAPNAGAFELFFFAATRDPALAPFAARFRYGRGSATHALLSPSSPHLTRLDAVLISHWVTGAGRSASVSAEHLAVAVETLKNRAGPLFSDLELD